MIRKRIVTDPKVAGGAPIIENTSTLVQEVLARLAANLSPHVVDQFPGLEPADLQAVLTYAAEVVGQKIEQSGQEGAAPDPISPDQTVFELNLDRILLVDDIKENLLLMQYMFKNQPYTVSTAATAQEALLKARQERPGLIISDVQMPGLSGLELLKELKADEQTSNIAVILVTAHQRGSKHTSQGLMMGADDYIYRPFMQDEFLSRVEAVLRVKRAEAEIRRQALMVARRNKGLELVNELALAVNSSLNFQEIFASAMQKLGQLLDAEAVSLLLLNEDNRGMVARISTHSGKHVSLPIEMPTTREQPEQVTLAQIPRLVLGILEDHYQELELAGDPGETTIQSILMQSKEQTLGAIAIINKRGSAFEEADWALLNSAAGIIAVAMENARLLEGAQQQVDDLIALNEIGRALTSTLDLNRILKQTTLLVQRALQSDAASLWLLDNAGRELTLIASSGQGAQLATGFHLPIERGIAGHVARTGEPYISTDVTRDGKYFEKAANLSNYAPRSILCLPVQVKSQTIGVMQVLHQNPNWFDQSDLRLAHPVANFVGIAVENARLFSEVQGFNRQLEQMVAERTRQLAEEKERTEAILASMADGLLVLDADNRILAANTVAERMLGFRLSEMLGQPLGPEQLKSPLWNRISDMARSSAMTVSVSVDVPSDRLGTFLSIQAHSAKVRNEAGAMIGTVIVLRDITALKEVERMKARFMAGVTHELKTPLSIIQLHSMNLLTYQDRLPLQKRTELLSSIQNQGKLLSQLIEDILDLSRLDAGVNEVEHVPLNLVQIIDRVVGDLHPLAEAKQIRLSWHRPSQVITILANSHQMERVVRNLVDNAIKYTPAGGLVDIQTRLDQADGRMVASLWVADTGAGIPVEQQARVFERFYRVDSSHTIPGTGLGLAIVKEIINAHGGQVKLRSAPARGSTFIITLPAASSTSSNQRNQQTTK